MSVCKGLFLCHSLSEESTMSQRFVFRGRGGGRASLFASLPCSPFYPCLPPPTTLHPPPHNLSPHPDASVWIQRPISIATEILLVMNVIMTLPNRFVKVGFYWCNQIELTFRAFGLCQQLRHFAFLVCRLNRHCRSQVQDLELRMT